MGREGDDREWDGWVASLTWWTWFWVSSRSWWTGKPGVLQSMGSHRVRYDLTTELNWTDRFYFTSTDWSVQNMFHIDSVLAGTMFLEIYPFLLGCPFCQYITVHSIFLWKKISYDVLKNFCSTHCCFSSHGNVLINWSISRAGPKCVLAPSIKKLR